MSIYNEACPTKSEPAQRKQFISNMAENLKTKGWAEVNTSEPISLLNELKKDFEFADLNYIAQDYKNDYIFEYKNEKVNAD